MYVTQTFDSVPDLFTEGTFLLTSQHGTVLGEDPFGPEKQSHFKLRDNLTAADIRWAHEYIEKRNKQVYNKVLQQVAQCWEYIAEYEASGGVPQFENGYEMLAGYLSETADISGREKSQDPTWKAMWSLYTMTCTKLHAQYMADQAEAAMANRPSVVENSLASQSKLRKLIRKT